MKEDSKVLNPNAKLDEMVLITQVYLNETYKNNSHWIKIDENGKTGWPTIRGLIRALQIETGISTPNGNFGPATEAACPTLKKDLNPSDKTQRLVYILQGAMWCKGFSPGGFTGTFGDGTESGVKKFQTSAGLAGAKVNGIADPMIFKALLNMDAYEKVLGGDDKIREIQMNLNRDYHKWIGLRPTDGRYGRDTNKALIYALQVEEGIEEPNGTFGPTTQSLLPTISYGSNQANFVKIAQYALYCNRYDPTGFTGTFGSNTLKAVREFQKFSMLPNTGNVGPMTWASLLVSSGDKNRKGTACDCSSEVTDARAKTLKANGYEIVGRYIAGGEWKKLKTHEAKVIFDNGLRLFPIFQKAGNSVDYFTETQGLIDGQEAVEAALEYGFPEGTTIYFAVDFDAVDDQVTSNILPYFRKVEQGLAIYNPRNYKIGVYGARNVCTRVGGKCEDGSLLGEGISESSFVCDMSTGFSGNLGYALPPDWAFDQIKEFTIGSGDGAIAIDNNICSNKDRGVSKLVGKTLMELITQVAKSAEQWCRDNGKAGYDEINRCILDYLRHAKYDTKSWNTIMGKLSEFVDYAKTQPYHDKILKYIDHESNGGVDAVVNNIPMDLGHLAATTLGYSKETSLLVPNFWTGWGGDLATGMADIVKYKYENKNTLPLPSDNFIADMYVIGHPESRISKLDIEADIDAMELAKKFITEPFEITFKRYFSNVTTTKRKELMISEELGLPMSADAETIGMKLYSKMAGIEGFLHPGGVMLRKFSYDEDAERYANGDEILAACLSFGRYLKNYQM